MAIPYNPPPPRYIEETFDQAKARLVLASGGAQLDMKRMVADAFNAFDSIPGYALLQAFSAGQSPYGDGLNEALFIFRRIDAPTL